MSTKHNKTKASIPFGRKTLVIGGDVAKTHDSSESLGNEKPCLTLNQLIIHLSPIEIAADRLICREGHRGDSLFIILDGQAEVSKRDQNGKKHILADLTSGDIFGEFAMLTNGWRHADVTSITAMKVIEITKEQILEASAKEPQIMQLFLKIFHLRHRTNLLLTNEIFSLLAPSASKWLAARCEDLDLEHGTALLRQGSRGEYLYIVVSGELEVTRRYKNKFSQLACVRAGDVVGEMAFLSGDLRMASVHATCSCQLFRIHYKDLDEVLAAEPRLAKALHLLVARRRLANSKI